MLLLVSLSMVQPLKTFCVKKVQIYFDRRSSVSSQVKCEQNKRRTTDSDVALNYLNETNFEVRPFKSKPQDVHWAIIEPCL